MISRAALRSLAGLPVALAALLAAAPAAGQSAPPRSLYVLSAADVAGARVAVQSDTVVAATLGAGPVLVQMSGVQLSKVSFANARPTRTPSRSVTVVLYNPRTRAGASARVQLGTNTVSGVEVLAPDEVPLFVEEAETALLLARGNAAVRTALGAPVDNYRLRVSGTDTRMPYSAEAMKLFAPSPRDACNTDRCVALHFRTPTGYLSVRVVVNLAQRTVTIVRRDKRQEGHGGMHR
jgi:hypothetical protein